MSNNQGCGCESNSNPYWNKHFMNRICQHECTGIASQFIDPITTKANFLQNHSQVNTTKIKQFKKKLIAYLLFTYLETRAYTKPRDINDIPMWKIITVDPYSLTAFFNFSALDNSSSDLCTLLEY